MHPREKPLSYSLESAATFLHNGLHMIQFFVDHDGAQGFRSYLGYRGDSITESIAAVEYEVLPSIATLPASSAIFAAVDQIGPTGRALASAIGNRLRHRGLTVLNDPERVLTRHDLLEALHTAGINRFRARRASEPLAGLRYPVFVREEHRHNGSQTALLPDLRSLERALTELLLRGYRRADLLIVEFCDVRSADGLYRKYSAFRVGDRLVPRHLHVSDTWVSRAGTCLVTEQSVDEERRYFADRPHDSWLSEVFRIANIEFGRIDYSIVDGVPQVWEINTNPALTQLDREAPADVHERLRPTITATRLAFHNEFVSALRAIDLPDVGLGELPIAVAPATRRKMTAETRSLRRTPSRVRLVQGALSSAPLQRLSGIIAPIAADLVHAINSLHHRNDGHSQKPSRP